MMRDPSLSILIFVKDKDVLISCTKAVYFSLVRNTRRERVWMSQPIHVLRSARQPSNGCLQRKMGSCHFSGSEDCSGWNMVWITNNAPPRLDHQ